MKIMEKMMGLMLDNMDQEEKKEMMVNMMEKFLSGMSRKDRMEMMGEMMPKMMKDINMMEMMPKMMMKMMGKQSFSGRTPDTMPGMNNMGPGFDFEERVKMMSVMIPRCMDSMFSELEPEERSKLVKEMLRGMADILEKHSS